MGEGDEEPGFIRLEFQELPADELLSRAHAFHAQMDQRRTTRHFAGREVPTERLDPAPRTARPAPPGAHLQPWTFVAISNPGLKRRIRDAAEAEEKRFYEERMPEAWGEVLTPLGTDYVKDHITEAPWIVVLFRQSQRLRGEDDMSPTYYSQESCGIAAGLFIAALHNMGLPTLTHTPSPMGFLRDILGDEAEYQRKLIFKV